MTRCVRPRPTGIVANAARGTLIDEAALVAALTDGTIAVAGLDVHAAEPHIDPVMLACPDLVLLPHPGSATREPRIAMGTRVADNLDAFFAGRPVHDRVA